MDDKIIVFFGEDTFYIKSKINQLIKKYDVDDYNLTTYDLEEVMLSDAINDAMTIPFMSENKVVVCKNAHFLSTAVKKNKIEHELSYLEEYIDNPTAETLLIITVPQAKLDRRSKLFKKLEKNATITECKLKGPGDLNAWARRQVAQAGLSIDQTALDAFVNRVKHSTELAFLEMKKLLLYAKDEDAIDIEMIEKVITKNIEDNVYDITNAILEKRRSRALEVYHDLIMYSEDPLRILGIIISKYREMLQVKMLIEKGFDQDGIQQYFHVKSGRAYFMVQNAKSVPRHKIEDHLRHLEQLDYHIKTGRVDKKHALEMFILST